MSQSLLKTQTHLTRVDVPPSLVGEHLIDNILLTLKRNQKGNVIPGIGYIHDILEIVDRSRGYFYGPRMDAYVSFDVKYKCQVYVPVINSIVTGTVQKVSSTVYIIKDGPVDIYIPSTKVPYDLQVGEQIQVKITKASGMRAGGIFVGRSSLNELPKYVTPFEGLKFAEDPFDGGESAEQVFEIIDSRQETLDRVSLFKTYKANRSSMWDRLKTAVNISEQIFISPTRTHSNVAKVEVVNRAFFKMWEILFAYPNIAKFGHPIKICTLADAPGGFIQAINRYRDVEYTTVPDGVEESKGPQPQPLSDLYFSVSIEPSEDNKQLRWDYSYFQPMTELANMFAQKPQQAATAKINLTQPKEAITDLTHPLTKKGTPASKLLFYKDSTNLKEYTRNPRLFLNYGDLTDLNSIEKYVDMVLNHTNTAIDPSTGAEILKGLGAHLITADGGMEVDDSRHKEQAHYKLFLGEIITALQIQAPNGSFVMKMYDFQSDFTVDLMYVLSSAYKEVKIIKPVTSRPCNNEIYIVCMGFENNVTPKLIAHLINTLTALNESTDDTIIPSLFEEYSESRITFGEICTNIRESMEDSRHTMLREALNIPIKSESGDYEIEPHRITIYQRKKINFAKKWCEKHNLPFNPDPVTFDNMPVRFKQQ